MKEIELGCQVRDVVTGFTGIAIGHVRYLAGKVEYFIRKQTGDGTLDERWLDAIYLQRSGDGLVNDGRIAVDALIASIPPIQETKPTSTPKPGASDPKGQP